MNIDKQIDDFLAAPAFAVVGASDDPYKYGHRCYKCLLQNGRKAYPVNPRTQEILGNPVYRDLSSLPESVEAISVITPPPVTEKVVDDAIASGVKHIWMQPGAESAKAIAKAEEAGISVISGGPCLLVVLGYRGI
ncbi:MAG: CoA-binding protein [Candidatus Obscuribacterales bacterium]|nr:CoA-binding protein [Candidatus Obscuribacterales bacterium]